jgi:hypothetical protein
MAYLGEIPDVITQGLPLLLSIALQIPGIVEPHICALEIAGKDLLEILPAIDRFSGQVIKPSSGHVSQVDGEELNDEYVTIHLAALHVRR